ncbi:MAG: SpoIIE family protein phosphatase [Erysipelotrichaceae bacterium]|nr:SpoIIE family protein phosphatase [Erysipelotrichaceae bacterium]MDD3924828.1 SpoIIE family protein phosphatase [Erysipelotrichaceae bacterium]MDD4642786.1 SpoIIE family protein phosphatase [Erysipelotrichaceae bacterium]
MSLFLETGYTSLNKKDEELCGDKVETIIKDDQITLVLADGLGSGVKANILATLTSKILCTLIANQVSIDECIETIIQSLPVCKVRKVAYSTFSIIHINDQGHGYLFEFDNPQAIYIHHGSCKDLNRESLNILNKVVYKSELNLSVNDHLLIMSDGAIHAGVGSTLNFGWQRDDIKKYIENSDIDTASARALAWFVAKACHDLYMGIPGDDTTIAAIKVKRIEKVDLLVGPPVDKDNDNYYVARFLNNDGKKIVCGGTSSQIVARYLNKEVKTLFDYPDKDVPPIGHIEGIDLTTEGVLTLKRLLELSKRYLSISDLNDKRFKAKDGASLLADMLFEKATHITFYVGQSINIAHQNLPIDISMKIKLVESLANDLRQMGKRIVVNYD